MNWLVAHATALRQAWSRLSLSPLSTLLAVIGIGIALALPAGGLQLLSQFAGLAGSAAATQQFTIFLKVDGERKTTLALAAKLKDRTDVMKVQVVLREETLARMKATDGLADVISALPKNPFPDAIVVTPANDTPEAIETLAAETRQWREIEHVQADADWARRFAALVRLAHSGVLMLAILLGIGLVAITFNTVRLQVMTRRAEVEVSGLLGATESFIRRPFLWYGALLGLLGGTVAWLIVCGAILWLHDPIAELAGLYGTNLSLGVPSMPESGMILGTAVLLGWFGAALSMRQYLR